MGATIAALGVLSCVGCAVSDRPVEPSLPTAEMTTMGSEITNPDETAETTLPTAMSAWVALAMHKSPELARAFADWRAGYFAYEAAGYASDPTLSYSYFVRAVETRVGPQRHKIGLRQVFPRIGELSAMRSEGRHAVQIEEHRFDRAVLGLRRRVADAYWKLWRVLEEHRLSIEHDFLLETMAASARARIETGAASLAELSQIELATARHHDHLDGHELTLRAARSVLAATAGIDPLVERVIVPADEPDIGLPAESRNDLVAALGNHPRQAELEATVARSTAEAALARVQRQPEFSLGAETILTGDAADPLVPGSGKDAVSVTVGVSLPFSSASASAVLREADERAKAAKADYEARWLEAVAEFDEIHAAVEEANRRVELLRFTLIPQAETAFDAVLGSYKSGRSNIAEMLLAQRELLDLQLELAGERAAHAAAWAKLEYVVGRSIAKRSDDGEAQMAAGAEGPNDDE